MNINDPPIHLKELGICQSKPHSEPSVTVPIWITQSALDGLNALIHFCEGYQGGGKGYVPGSFELVMFYRTLNACIHAADKKDKESGAFK